MNKQLIHSVFESRAAENPHKTAIEHLGRHTTYAELNGFANGIAHCLLQHQVATGECIGVFLDSSPRYVSAILGISKAGGAFMPLDPELTARRLESILRVTKPRVIVTGESNKAALLALLAEMEPAEWMPGLLVLDWVVDAAFLTVFDPKSGSQTIRNYPKHNPAVAVGGDDSGYIVYTSGSTGTPKIIEGRHKGLSHFIHWEIAEFGLDSTVKVSQLAPVTFDVSLRDIFVPLLSGGTLCIPAKESRHQIGRLLNWLIESEVTLMHCVPTLFRLLTSQLAESPDPSGAWPTLRHVLLAGEPLYGKDVLAWRAVAGPGVQLVNVYGPSETTLAKLFYRVPDAAPDPARILPLGKPIANTQALILKNNRLCEIGETGEICIRTPFRSKGYFGDPALTREKFVENPLNPGQEDIIYRTGDLGKYLPDRNVEFVGRHDTQVKIKGNRVELAEIEYTLMAYGAIRQAVVTATAVHADEELVLIAYYTGEAPVAEEDLRGYLRQHLPLYMLPSFYVQLAAFPVNHNGKVDKKALPLPQVRETVAGLPATPAEARLAGIWKQVLKLPAVGVTDSFFDIGGSSLKGIQMISRIHKELQVLIKLPDLFANPTIRELAAVVEKAGTRAYEAIRPAPPQAHYPLSQAQRRQWIISHRAEKHVAYNITRAYRLEGALDREALRGAFETLVARHESLRTVFVTVDGEPRQKIMAPGFAGFQLREIDAPGQTDQAALQALIGEEAYAYLDLVTGPLLQAKLIRLAADQFLFVFVMHHIISDGWSMELLAREVLTEYQAAVAGTPGERAALRIHYKDYAAWQDDFTESEPFRQHEAYWLDQFSEEVPALQLPLDRARPKQETFHGGDLDLFLDPALTRELKKVAARQDATLFMALLAVIKVFFYKYTGLTDVVVGSPVAGRDHADLEEQIGLYINTLALRTRFAAGDAFPAILEKVRGTALAAYEHQAYPYNLLMERLEKDGRLTNGTLFNVLVEMENLPAQMQGAYQLPGVAVTPVKLERVSSKFDLSISLSESGDRIGVRLRYNTDLFLPATIEAMGRHLQAIAAAAVANPQTPVGDLQYLAEAEKDQLVYGCNQTAVAYPADQTVHQLFEAQAARTPQAAALRFGERTLTYQQLNEQANQVAHYLRNQCGVQPGDRVGLLVDRSEKILVGILGIFKAGGAYVPVDPVYPVLRKAYILQDSGVKAVLTETRFLGHTAPAPAVDLNDSLLREEPVTNPAVVNTPADLAYVIYTSGTTGEPKGALIAHQSVVNLSEWLIDRLYRPHAGPLTALLTASINFDASVQQLFAPLLCGSQLVLIAEETKKDPGEYIDQLVKYGVDVVDITPGYLKVVLDALADRFPKPAVRYTLVGGEALTPGLVEAYYRLLGSASQLINVYGVTEATVNSLYAVLDPAPGSKVNVGAPLPNTQVYILDAQGNPVPARVAGEICIAGDGLARGYLNREDLTRRKFVDNPFAPGQQLYRTGDHGRRLPDGRVEFIGRKDHQVKIRGYRIELGEVEAVLAAHPDVKDALVAAKADSAGDKYMVAFAAAPAGAEAKIKAYLAERLPEYMVPGALILVPQFPLNGSGKVDRQALLDLEEATRKGKAQAVAVPMNPTEAQIAGIWRAVLGKENLGVDDNFFEHGGQSLKAMQVISRIHKEMGAKIELKSIFKTPTIRQLAQAADAFHWLAQAPVASPNGLNDVEEIVL